MNSVLGLDASSWQGDKGMSFSWLSDLDQAGVRFGIFRASVGMARDTSVKKNLRRATLRGWFTGTYHYLMPAMPEAQARLYASRCGKGLCVLDVEQSGIDRSDIRAFVKEFRSVKPGRPLLLYTSEWKWRSLTGNMDATKLFDGLWNAYWQLKNTHYPEDLPEFQPRVNYGGFRRADLWQFGAFHTPGRAIVDGNAFYGTNQQLRELFSNPRPPIRDRDAYIEEYNARILLAKMAVKQKFNEVPAADDTAAKRLAGEEATPDILTALDKLLIIRSE